MCALIFLCVALIGFSDATFLAVEHFQGRVPPCSVLKGCERVTTSQYATIGPIPVALLGSLYYLIFIIGSIAFLDTKRTGILRSLAFLSLAGIVASGFFVYLQLAVLHAICIYCMASAVTSTLLCVNGMVVLAQQRKKSV